MLSFAKYVENFYLDFNQPFDLDLKSYYRMIHNFI